MRSRTCLLLVLAGWIGALAGCGSSGMGNIGAKTYTISAAVSGLSSGETLVLQNNGADNLTFTSSGTQSFSQAISSGGSYAVTVLTQPSGESCTIGSNASGTANADVSVSVACSATSFTISATVTGLNSGDSVSLQDNSGDNLTFTSNTTQTFASSYAGGSSYSVSIATQPAGENCTLSSNASGTITSNLTVNVTCAALVAQNFTISASVSGLNSGATLILQDNGGSSLTFTSNSTQSFSQQIASGGSYAVTIVTQPTGETCTLGSNSSGTATANVTVDAICAANPTYTISAAVTGLNSGATLILQDSKSDSLTFTSNTTQTFATSYASGSSYSVSIATQPAGENCSLGSNNSGTITSNVTVNVTCSSTLYTISAAVTGLNSGASLTLQDNGGNNLTFTANGSQSFSQQIASGSTYAVTILTPPGGETCTLGPNSSGTATSAVTVSVACSATLYTISASVTGLNSGASVVLQDNGASNLSFASNTTQSFSQQIASGAAYAVTILTQPTGETCTLGSNGSGTATANVNVTVTCTTTLYTISATVTGLISGASVVLQDNGTGNLTFSSNSTQSFSQQIGYGASYATSILTQPIDEICVMGSGSSGSVTSNVNVSVICTPNQYVISASVAGLNSGASLALQDSKGDALTFTSNTTQPFATSYFAGSSYSVSVTTQPTGETCSVGSNGTGTVTSNVTVSVTCSSTLYTISAAVTGLNSGATLVLQDNAASNLTFTSNTTQAFSQQIASGSSYAVTILTQPTGETCTLGSNSSGTATANVTVNVTCSATLYTISAAVTGLNSGATLVLQDNAASNLTFTSNTTQAFSQQIASGSSYAVTILTQPAGETCTLGSNSSGTATANVTVNVTCSATLYTISAAVTGLNSGATLVLQDNAASNLTFTSNTTQAFSQQIASGSSYAVTILTQPTGETCTLGSNSSGTATANVTVNVTCSATLYTISAAVTGLNSGATLVLQDNAASNLTFTSNTTQAFSQQIASGSSYAVTILTQPAGETCTLGSNSSGTATANVTVNVTCSATLYTISAAVTGLNSGATLVLQDNAASNLTFTSNTTQAFSQQIASGSSYAVTILTQPAGETCTLGSNSSGTATANVTVNVTCSATLYTISAAVTGLNSGATLVLQENSASNLTFTSNTTQAFSQQIASGSSYAVTILTQPAGETCTLGSNSSGTATANVTVNVTCSATLYTISAAVTGLNSGATLVLQDNAASNLTFTSNTTQAFSQQIASGSSYAVTVLTQPTGETCTLGSNSSGTATANVTVNVTCSATLYTISAAVTGLNSGATLVLQDNAANNLTFTSNTTQAFSQQIASGASYAVTILTQPAGETCTLGSNSSGTATANVTVNVTCSATLYTISAAVTGLNSGATLALADNVGDALTFTTNNTQTFASSYASGSSYTVSITAQPSGENCTLGSDASGTITSNITVVATCAANGTYTIGGSLYSLGGGSVVLQNNSANNLTLSANGSFTFSNSVTAGGSYNVTVHTQPSSPVQVCTVSNGSGTANANVTNVQVVCIAEWTWLSGSNTTSQQGNYGSKKVTNSSNSPGARYGSATWIDSAGTLWMFGGIGYDSVGVESYLNDLWKYSPSSKEWTWWNGPNIVDSPGIYTGTANTLVPGARVYPVSWIDSSGNFWLFGGFGIDVNSNTGPLNDLWEFSNGNWIFVGGSQTFGASGVYNAGTSNFPGARYAASGVLDQSGNFWMFGGNGIDSTGTEGDLNDLWEYSNGIWTWVSGADTEGAQGVYSTTASPSNVPGARLGASGWIDSAGDFWLFGGDGLDSTGAPGYLNDIWEYSQGEWVWAGGADIVDQPASYGTQGIPATANIPGGREHAVLWNTPSGNVWLFGGVQTGGGELNDLWEYSGGQWTYMSGSQFTDQFGVYGTEGTASITNLPGGRDAGLNWTDASGNLWLMGGYGLGNTAGLDTLNDLWEFEP